MNETLSVAIQKYKKRHGVASYSVANAAKMHESKLSKIINGAVQPTQENKDNLAKVLNIPVSVLFQ